MDQKTIIELASSYLRENNLKFAAIDPAISRILAETWINNQNNQELDDLLKNLGFGSSSFSTWWDDVYNKYKTYSAIATIYNTDISMYGTPTNALPVVRRTIYDLGIQETAYDDSTNYQPLGIPRALLVNYDRWMNVLFNNLFVLEFRRVKSGDSTKAKDYANEYGIQVSESKPTVKQNIQLDKIWDEIPNGLFEQYKVEAPNDRYVDSYSFIKNSIESFIKKTYLETSEGRKLVALKNLLGTLNYNFDSFWPFIEVKYKNYDNVTEVLERDIETDNTVTPSIIRCPYCSTDNPATSSNCSGCTAPLTISSVVSKAKFKTLGNSTMTQNALTAEIEKATNDLINAIIYNEREMLLKQYRLTKPIAEGLGAISDFSDKSWDLLSAILPKPGGK